MGGPKIDITLSVIEVQKTPHRNKGWTLWWTNQDLKGCAVIIVADVITVVDFVIHIDVTD